MGCRDALENVIQARIVMLKGWRTFNPPTPTLFFARNDGSRMFRLGSAAFPDDSLEPLWTKLELRPEGDLSTTCTERELERVYPGLTKLENFAALILLPIAVRCLGDSGSSAWWGTPGTTTPRAPR